MKKHEVVGSEKVYVDFFDMVEAIGEAEAHPQNSDREISDMPESIQVSALAFLSAVESVKTGERNIIELIDINISVINSAVSDVVYIIEDCIADVRDYTDEVLTDLLHCYMSVVYYLSFHGGIPS